MMEKKRSTAASYPFPFFGAGDASYFEWAEVHVRFSRPPTRTEKAAIGKRVPPPLRDSIDWEGEQLMVASGQFAHIVISDAYAADPNDKSSADDDDEDFDEDGEYGSRFFFAKTSQVTKFNEDIEAWLQFAHTKCPILCAFRHEDGESGGTKLSAWHKWSMKQLPPLLPRLEALMIENRDGCASYMLRGILAMAMENATEKSRDKVLPEHFRDWLEPGRKERVALVNGNPQELVQRLQAGPIAKETLEALAEAVERCDGPKHDKELRTLLPAALILLAQPRLPAGLLVALVSAAARTLHREGVTADERHIALQVLAEAQKQCASDGKLGDELANLAYWLAKNGLFLESLEIFERLIELRGLAKTTYCNALWAVMSDNNKLPVQTERAQRFLAACLPLGPENPAIFYNAACIYFELGDKERVFVNLQAAIDHHYEKPELMQNEPLFAPLRSDPRFVQIFAPAPQKKIGTSARAKPPAKTAATKRGKGSK